MKVMVNDEDHEVQDGTTVAALLERLELGPKGIAVALNGSVLPRSEWSSALPADARVEVVTAVQGG